MILINPLSPLPKLDNLKSDAALEEDQMDQMDKRELYLYNKRRGIEKDNPITEESLNEIRSKYSEFGLAQGGIASWEHKEIIMKKENPTLVKNMKHVKLERDTTVAGTKSTRVD